MRKVLLFAFVAALATSEAAEQPGQSYVPLGNGIPSGLSPNGKYAVGTAPRQKGDKSWQFQSFLWNSETGTTEYLTSYDATDPDFDLDLTGRFYSVNDDGVIVGSVKDKDMFMEWHDGFGSSESYLMSAAIWKDGKLIKLGYGDFKLEDFINLEDGSAAVAITADSKKVVGYVMRGNAAYYTPCGWELNEETGEWDFSRYAIPEGYTGGEVGSISADGSIAVGYVKKGQLYMPVYWTSPDECHMIEFTAEDSEYKGKYNCNYAYTVSANGEFILFTLNKRIPCVYNVKEGTYEKVGINPDAGKLSIRGIADNGDTAGTFVLGNSFVGFKNIAFWYSYENRMQIPFDYFTNLYATEIADLPSFETAEIQSISADGSVFFGSTDGEMWVLHTDKERIILPPAVKTVKVENDEFGQLSINWEASQSVPEGFVLKGYNVYIDGSKVGSVDAGSRLEFIAPGLTPGIHQVEIEQEFTTQEGKMFLSPKSKAVSVAVAESFDIPLFDNFESSSFDTNCWTVELFEGRVLDDLKWQFRIPYDNNQTLTLSDFVVTTEPYSSAVTTRYLDATKLDNVYVSFARELMYANRDDWDLTTDWLSLEISFDGKEWSPVRDYLAKDVVAGRWVYEKIDLSSLAAGKRFKLRLRTHGEAKAQLIWYIDTFKVGSNDEKDAPQGLFATVGEDGKVKLDWKNTINAYELSYFENSTYLYEVKIGDEGNPFIAANSFDAEQLKPYVGKFISSVTTFLYDTDTQSEEMTKASIMIFADNELVYEQEIVDYDNGETFTVKLDKAVMIEEGKEYKIGMKIYDYSAESMPIYYQVTELFRQWKSDLYSQDGGKTWQSLKDYYSDKEGFEEWGLCVWPMRANITDEEEIYDNYSLDKTLEGYDIYRNGVRINDKLSYPVYLKYVDESPLESASYQVEAFYTDGTSSLKSAPCEVKITSSVDKVTDDEVAVYPNPATDYIKIRGEFDSAALYSVAGELVLRATGDQINVSDIQRGLYLLTVERNGKRDTHRVFIR